MMLARWKHWMTVSISTAVLFAVSYQARCEESEFARTTIDLGLVVSDIEKSVSFYTQALGFMEVEGFTAAGDFVGDAGLTDNATLEVRVLVLGDDESATKVKLMQVPGVKTKRASNEFIHSQFGYRYLTVFVNDTTAAMRRLEKAGVKPLAKGPVALPKPLPAGVFLTVVRDPDGNMVELVGPEK